jgi:hypothetical protein
VRRSLGPVLQGLENEMRRRNESALGRGTWNIFTAAAGSTNWFRTENSFLQSFSRELERQKMGPRRFENLTNLVEWRFLRRPEALIFGLPDHHRADWIEARSVLDQEIDTPTSDEPGSQDREHWRRRMEAKRAEYERQAVEATGLSPATRDLFESRRADLERLSPEDDAYLIHGLDSTMPLSGF